MTACISGKLKGNQVPDVVQGEYQVILKVKVRPGYLKSGKNKRS